MSDTDHSFNVILSDERYDKLQILAKALDCPKARAIRQAVDALYFMKVDHIPTCATGQPCYVPHMHTPPQQPLAPVPAPQPAPPAPVSAPSSIPPLPHSPPGPLTPDLPNP